MLILCVWRSERQRKMYWDSIDLTARTDDESLDMNESNVTNSTPRHYQEDDARWCYNEGRVEVCVR